MSEPVLQILDRFKIAAYVDEDEAEFLCPFHEENTPSCGMNIQTGMWHCFGCDRGGSLLKFVTLLLSGDSENDKAAKLNAFLVIYRAGMNPIPELPEPDVVRRNGPQGEVEVLEQWKWFHKVNWERMGMTNPVASYLIEKRGFRRSTLQAFDVRLTDGGDYPVVFPVFQNGSMIGWVKRRIDGGKRKYLYNDNFPGHTAMAYHKVNDTPCVVVEGVLDYMKAAQFGAGHCAALLGWKIKPAQVEYLKSRGVEEVVCALDNTLTGEQGEEELELHFRKVHTLNYPGKHRKDVADLNVNEWNLAMWKVTSGLIKASVQGGV